MGVSGWTSSSGLRCFFRYVSYVVRVAIRTTVSYLVRHGLRHVMRLLSICLFALLLCLQGNYAYAEDELKPEEYVEAYEEKVSSDEIIVMRGDGYLKAEVSQLRSTGDNEAGDDTGGSIVSSVSANVFTWVIENAITNHESELSIMDDLAWRYYHADSSLRETPPIEPLGNARPLSDFNSWGDWDSYCRSNYTYNVPYRLVGLSDGKSWDSTSPNADIEYGRWYDYYNGITPDSGGGGEGDGSNPEINNDTISLGTCAGSVLKDFVPYAGVSINISVNSTFINTVNSNINDGYTNIIVYATQDKPTTSNGNQSIYTTYVMSKTPISVTVGNVSEKIWYKNEQGQKVYDNYDLPTYTINTDGPTKYYRQTFSVTSLSISTGTSLSLSYSGSSSNWSNGLGGIGTTYTKAAVWSPAGSGTVTPPTPEPYPVYSPIGGKPDNTTINSPTYNNPTYTNNNYNVTQTDVDLQPVIDAINVVNQNLQEMDENLQIGLTDLHTMLQGWQDTWVESMTELYEDITDYLWRIEKYLEAILGMMQDDDILPEPTYDTGNTPQQQVDVNMNLLKNKFPFSLPWDVYAVLSALEAPPTPIEFDFPVILTEYTIHVDCSPLAPMAAVSRSMSVVLFIAGLLMNTKKFLIVINTAISE